MFSNPDHIIIYLILSAIFIIWGYKARTLNTKSYYITAILPITIYSLIEGFRYGRGNDYLSYKRSFEYPLLSEVDQPLFKWLNLLLNKLNFNYVGAYIVYSLIFIICAAVLIKEYKKYSFGIFAFFLPATNYFSESCIRQAVGFSFIFLAIRFFYDRRWVYFVLSIVVASAIHTSNLLIILIIGSIYFIRKPLPIYFTIPLYIFFTYLFDMSNVNFIADNINNLGLDLGTHFQSYIDNSDEWFSEEAITDIYSQSFTAQTIRTIFDISVIFLGFYALKLKPNVKILPIYNTFVFGALFYKAFFNLEILRRIAEPLYLLWFVIVAFAFYIVARSNRKTMWTIMAKYAIILYVIAYWGRFIFLNPEARFVWNF